MVYVYQVGVVIVDDSRHWKFNCIKNWRLWLNFCLILKIERACEYAWRDLSCIFHLSIWIELAFLLLYTQNGLLWTFLLTLIEIIVVLWLLSQFRSIWHHRLWILGFTRKRRFRIRWAIFEVIFIGISTLYVLKWLIELFKIANLNSDNVDSLRSCTFHIFFFLQIFFVPLIIIIILHVEYIHRCLFVHIRQTRLIFHLFFQNGFFIYILVWMVRNRK